jgi:hypothetical protein
MTSGTGSMTAVATGIDWASITWVTILAGITFSCLAIKTHYARIAEQGAVERFMAHAVIGYFGIGMILYGASAAASEHFVVPGGAAWNGSIAVLGGISAFVIGSTTLLEHAVRVRSLARDTELQSARVTTS